MSSLLCRHLNSGPARLAVHLISDSVPLQISFCDTANGGQHTVSETLPPTPPTIALPTPASILSLKPKSFTNVGTVLAKSCGIPDPQQGLLRNRLDPDENWYERKVRQQRQGMELPQLETGPHVISSSVMTKRHDPFSFVYDKLALQAGRHYEVGVEEIPAYKTLGAPRETKRRCPENFPPSKGWLHPG